MKNTVSLLVSLLLFASLNVLAQTTVIIQPHFGYGSESELTYADSTNPICFGNPFQYYADTNEYNNLELDAIAWTHSSCPILCRHIIRFIALGDTSLIPHNAIILSAQLVLFGLPSSPYNNYGNSYYPGTPYPDLNPTVLNELVDSFNAYTVTWNTQPSIMHTDSASIPPSYSHWNETDTINVTSMVADMVANTNTGFLFKLQNESYYQERMYASCYYSDSTLHPMLIVSFMACTNPITLEPKPDTVIEGYDATFTVSSAPGTVTYQWQEDPGTGFVNLTNVVPYSGVTTDTLRIENTTIDFDSTHYRCIVSNGPCADTSSSAILLISKNTGIKTLSAGSISIFPNPANDNIRVQLPAGINTGNMQLIDELGQVVSEEKITGNTVTFDLHKLSAAIYMLKVSANGSIIYMKVVKK